MGLGILVNAIVLQEVGQLNKALGIAHKMLVSILFMRHWAKQRRNVVE